jgi:toxin ParE1/3/4
VKKIQVIWTDESISDLDAIYEFIARKSPKSAQKIIRSILERTVQLETFPQAGSPHETKAPSTREYRYLVEGHYKIIYSRGDEAIYVETVIDTRQNPDTVKI